MRFVAVLISALTIVAATALPAAAQCCLGSDAQQQNGGMCCPGRQGGRGRGEAHQADMKLFHFLLENRDQVRRSVKNIPNGVETLTESDDPEVVRVLQAHVTSMLKRVAEQRPIHARDPLFAELFRHGDQIVVDWKKTDKGTMVRETSKDPYVTQLIRAHAQVVNQFMAKGFSEMRVDHELPEPPKTD